MNHRRRWWQAAAVEGGRIWGAAVCADVVLLVDAGVNIQGGNGGGMHEVEEEG
jgi:hypothetical protein